MVPPLFHCFYKVSAIKVTGSSCNSDLSTGIPKPNTLHGYEVDNP